MKPTVIIKTNAYGLIISLDPDLPFDHLLSDVEKKFREAARFFRHAQMAVTFKGRELTEEEEYQLISVMTENAQFEIVCLVDESEASAERYKEAVTRTLQQQREGQARIHRGTLKNGDKLECDSDLVILGDVNPGATVITSGNLVVLGCVMGSVTAGCAGRNDAFVTALILKPAFLKIADKASRSAITKRIDTGEYAIEPKIAVIRDERIVLEKLKGSVFGMLSRERKKE